MAIVDETMPLLYLPMQYSLSYMQYVMFGGPSTKNAEAFQTLKVLIESSVNENELGISHLESRVLYASRVTIIAMLIESDYY